MGYRRGRYRKTLMDVERGVACEEVDSWDRGEIGGLLLLISRGREERINGTFWKVISICRGDVLDCSDREYFLFFERVKRDYKIEEEE